MLTGELDLMMLVVGCIEMMLVLLLIVVMARLVRFVFKTSDLTEVFLGFTALILMLYVEISTLTKQVQIEIRKVHEERVKVEKIRKEIEDKE